MSFKLNPFTGKFDEVASVANYRLIDGSNGPFGLTYIVSSSETALAVNDGSYEPIFYVNTIDKAVGVNTDVSTAKIGGSGIVMDIVGLGSSVGALRMASDTTDATFKNARFLTRHYSNATEEDINFFQITSTDSATFVYYGGGSTLNNASTSLGFYTAATTSTLQGSQRMNITSGGKVQIGIYDTSNTAQFLVQTSICVANVLTNSTNKVGRIRGMHYTSTEEQMTGLLLSSTATTNVVNIGGGTSIENAATLVRTYTAATNTTVTGTARQDILSTGEIRWYCGSGTTTDYLSLNATASLATLTGTSVGITITTDGSDTTLGSGGEIIFTDTNKAASSYAGSLKFSETAAEWSDFETSFGEVSLLNALGKTNFSSAVIADNVLVRGDGGARGIQGSGWSLADTDILSAGGELSMGANAINNTTAALTVKTTGSWDLNLTSGANLAIDATGAVTVGGTYVAFTADGVVAGAGQGFTFNTASATSGNSRPGSMNITIGNPTGTGGSGNLSVASTVIDGEGSGILATVTENATGNNANSVGAYIAQIVHSSAFNLTNPLPTSDGYFSNYQVTGSGATTLTVGFGTIVEITSSATVSEFAWIGGTTILGSGSTVTKMEFGLLPDSVGAVIPSNIYLFSLRDSTTEWMTDNRAFKIDAFGTDTYLPTSIQSGAMGAKRTAVADADYTALVTDGIIAYTSISTTRTVTLPTVASTGATATNVFRLVIKNESGTAQNIVIDGNGAETVDGAANATITGGYDSLSIYCNGTAWFIE